MSEPPSFHREPQPAHGVVERLSARVRRVVAPNPGPFSYHGTNSFIVGNGRVGVIDPGPDLAAHVEALLRALAGETVAYILVTHAHRDHWPALPALQRATGAASVGFARAESAAVAFQPDIGLRDGEAIEGRDWRLEAVHTPGHASDHLCFHLPDEDTLFTGDHVMGWSTSVVVPPDGDMAAYMASLESLARGAVRLFRPAHGPAIPDGPAFAAALLAHRRERERAILAHLAAGVATIPALVVAIYPTLAPTLAAAAGRSVLAHLVQLVGEGRVACDGAPSAESVFRFVRS